MSNTPPTDVIRDGSLKASIWENNGEKGVYFTTTFAKTYRGKDEKLHDTNVFNNSDLLKVSELARQAYGRTNELRQERLQSREPEQRQDSRQERAEAFLSNGRDARDRDYGHER